MMGTRRVAGRCSLCLAITHITYGVMGRIPCGDPNDLLPELTCAIRVSKYALYCRDQTAGAHRLLRSLGGGRRRRCRGGCHGGGGFRRR